MPTSKSITIRLGRFTLQQYITMCQYANKQRYGVSSLTYWHIAILTH